MAKNNGRNRDYTKWIRDKAKKAYEKADCCAICGTQIDLELHHTHSITHLAADWAARKNYDISTDDGILAVRDEFIAEHQKELYQDVYTLCNRHHVALHRVYGKSPSNSSADKQGTWIERQRAKLLGGESDTTIVTPDNSIRTFSAFY